MNDDAILFRTDRTIVRRYVSASERRALADDPDVRRFSQWPDASDEAFAASIAAMHGRTPFDRSGWMNFAITLADGVFAGDHAVVIEAETAKLGIALLSSMRGRGLAQEVITGAVEMLRRHGVSRVQAEIDPDNAASLATFQRAGLERVRLATDHLGQFWLLERTFEPR